MAQLRIVIVEGPGVGRDAELTGTVTVGRDPAAGLAVDDPEASRQHAEITAREEGAVVDDLGSTNGTFVNDVRIEATREVKLGDRIRIGTTVIELQGVEAPAAAAEAAAPPPAEAPGPEAAAPPPLGRDEVPPPAAAPPAAVEPLGAEYPITVDAPFPEEGIDRWRALVQWWLLPLPHFVVLFFVVIAAYFAAIGAFFAILVTGQYPRGIFNFLAGTGRWLVRVSGYYYFFTQRYPPFSLDEEPDYPVRAEFPYPERGIARWRPLVHWLLLIPHYIVLGVLGIVVWVCHIAAAFSILFSRNYPPALFDLILGYLRWQARVNAYNVWFTERYPPFSLSA
jgi:hypothetical protein